MARYLSVDEAAEILGTTERTVRGMLNSVRLAGSQTMDRGKSVWRVHATKELLQKLEQPCKADGLDIETVDVTAASETVEADFAAEGETTPSGNSQDWYNAERDKMRLQAEEFVKPLMQRVEEQTLALREKDRVIEEQAQQLRLLPDLEKRAKEEAATAEAERKASELKAMEVEALNKQVNALQNARLAEKELIEKAAKALDELEALKIQVEMPWWKKLFVAHNNGQ